MIQKKWKVIPNGATNYDKYRRYQDDMIHMKNMKLIRDRKNKFLFDKKKRKSPPKNLFKLNHPFSDSVAVHYTLTKNNQYLGSKIDENAKRHDKMKAPDSFGFAKTKVKFSNSVRGLREKQIFFDNLSFAHRLSNIHSSISHKKLEKEFEDTQKKTMHIRKIQPCYMTTFSYSTSGYTYNYNQNLNNNKNKKKGSSRLRKKRNLPPLGSKPKTNQKRPLTVEN